MDNANSSEHSKEDDGNKDMEEFNEEEWKKAKPALSLEELTTAKKRVCTTEDKEKYIFISVIFLSLGRDNCLRWHEQD
jgi:hypothetical protein